MCIQRNGRNGVSGASQDARLGTTHRPARPAVSSIGLAWPPKYDAWNNRIKGFYPVLINDVQGLRWTKEMVDGATGAIKEHPEATRLTLRCIVRNGVDLETDPDYRRFRELAENPPEACRPGRGFEMREAEDVFLSHAWPTEVKWPMCGISGPLANVRGIVEARMDIGHVLPGFSLAYIGYTAESRQIDWAIGRAEREAIERINQENAPTTPTEAYARLERANLRIERLMHPSDEEIAHITRLYQQAFQKYLFDINTNSIGEIVDNSNLALVGRNQRGDIISSLIAEHVKIRLDGRDVHLIELSEFATDREYRGHGLMTALQFRALEMLRDLYDPRSTVIYIEGRAPWMPVNISIRRTGAVYCGKVSQHCVIVSDRSPGMQYTGDYEDLSVWVHKPQ